MQCRPLLSLGLTRSPEPASRSMEVVPLIAAVPLDIISEIVSQSPSEVASANTSCPAGSATPVDNVASAQGLQPSAPSSPVALFWFREYVHFTGVEGRADAAETSWTAALSPDGFASSASGPPTLLPAFNGPRPHPPSRSLSPPGLLPVPRGNTARHWSPQ